jgi:hypothetical protein
MTSTGVSRASKCTFSPKRSARSGGERKAPAGNSLDRSTSSVILCDQPKHQPLCVLEVMLAPSRGARLENACARCKHICGSNSSHNDRQYCAVDSITASSTLRSCSHVDKRRNSPGMVANRRRSGFDSGVCASMTTTIRTFLCTSIPAILSAIETFRQEACAKTSNTVTCYQPSQRDRWRNTDWFKNASQTKLGNGLNSSRVAPVFAVPRQFDRRASGSTRFSSLWVGHRPVRNSEAIQSRMVVQAGKDNSSQSIAPIH